MLRPAEVFTVKAKQSVGAYNFTRSFVRLDSGKLPWGSSFFASYSYTSAEKWRGAGDQRRLNGEFGWTQKLSDRGSVELFGVWHDTEGNSYRALNYNQSRQLSDFYKYDYNRYLTGRPAADIYYYDFNRYDFTNKAAFGKAELKIGDHGKLSFRPYYWREDGYTLSGSGNLLGRPGVTDWKIEHETYGGVLKYDLTYDRHHFTLGYWYQEMEAPPPPTAQKAYRVASDGSLTFAGWSMLAKHTNHETNSPFVNLESRIGRVSLTAGVRYLQYREPSFKYYDGSSVPDVSYDDAFDYNPSLFPDMVVRGKMFREWLPNFGIAYPFRDDMTVRGTYGRGYGRQNWGSVASTYSANRARFQAAGVTLQDLWRKLSPEISDNFDLGMRYEKGNWYVEPTVFYGIYRDKQANIYDPDIGATYHQSTQEAHSYGAELSVGGKILENLNLFFSASYNRFTFDKDVRTAAGKLIEAKGNQVSDCPEWSAKLGATYKLWDISVSPVIRYMGSRYGDMNNTQRVPAYVVADLNIAYEKGVLYGIKDFSAGVSIANLLNKKYIGIISGSEYVFDGSPGYYQGAPTTVVFTISGKF
ncbi:MAG: ferrichrome outer membrane transporter [Syntrophorhabdus sp. PtaB.Bin006]|nr:MAG: ferrichrome outer membrane transporter [Syntrophorhabdus sp. PtaB.Bin006]